MARRILYLVTEDWYFLSHRLPMARAAKGAGFEVHVATRVGEGRSAIVGEGFVLHPLGWRRGSRNPFGNLKAVAEARALLRRLQPDILHNIALKPVLIGSLAASGLRATAVVNSVAGLGSVYLARSALGAATRMAVNLLLARLLDRQRSRTVVQNPDDRAALEDIGVRAGRVVLIPGSGVDTRALRPMPEPAGPVTAAFVGRMLEDKGLRALREAHGMLRERGCRVDLLLAGDCDPENPGSLSAREVRAWSGEPGVQWLGHVPDVRTVWARAHLAVLPSRREGLPLSLLEAAACGRPMVATDVPGCREIAREGETALTVAVDDAAALASAIERLAKDGALRHRFGAAARALAEERFSADAIGQQTVALYESLLTASD